MLEINKIVKNIQKDAKEELIENNNNKECPINNEFVDGVLKKLEENKAKSKEDISIFVDEAIAHVEEAEEKITTILNSKHKNGTGAISEILTELQELQECTKENLEKSKYIFKKLYVLPHCQDNIDFVLGIVKRCIDDEKISNASLKSFLHSFSSQPEMLDTVKRLKECIFVQEYQEHESPELDNIETREQLITAMNKGLDVLCDNFDETIKEVKSISTKAQKRITELKEALLEEVEQKYNRLCDEVFEMEEEPECENEPPKKKMRITKLQDIPDKLCFTKFDNDFTELLFKSIIIPAPI